jgi:hypothetical protein
MAGGGRNLHKFSTEERKRGLEKAAAARRAQGAANRARKEAAAHKPVETVEEIPERLEEAINPAPAKAHITDLAATFTQFLILGTVLAALGFQQPAVAMTDAEAKAIARPVANFFATSELNRRFGRYLIGSNDYVALVWALYQYGQRVVTNWIPRNEKIQSVRYSAAPGNAAAPGSGPIASPKSANHHDPASDGITIKPTIIGWRRD